MFHHYRNILFSWCSKTNQTNQVTYKPNQINITLRNTNKSFLRKLSHGTESNKWTLESKSIKSSLHESQMFSYKFKWLLSYFLQSLNIFSMQNLFNYKTLIIFSSQSIFSTLMHLNKGFFFKIKNKLWLKFNRLHLVNLFFIYFLFHEIKYFK